MWETECPGSGQLTDRKHSSPPGLAFPPPFAPAAALRSCSAVSEKNDMKSEAQRPPALLSDSLRCTCKTRLTLQLLLYKEVASHTDPESWPAGRTFLHEPCLSCHMSVEAAGKQFLKSLCSNVYWYSPRTSK